MVTQNNTYSNYDVIIRKQSLVVPNKNKNLSTKMLTRLGSRALSMLSYSSNNESSSEKKFDDSKVISGDWVFIREKRPQRNCTKRNARKTDEWCTVARKNSNKVNTNTENEYELVDDIFTTNTEDSEKNDKAKGWNVAIEEDNSVHTVLTKKQKKLLTVAEESKVMFEQGITPKRLQNNTFSTDRNQSKRQNKSRMHTCGNKRGRKRHMMADTYSGKGGRRNI